MFGTDNSLEETGIFSSIFTVVFILYELSYLVGRQLVSTVFRLSTLYKGVFMEAQNSSYGLGWWVTTLLGVIVYLGYHIF